MGYHAIDTSYNLLKLSYENNASYYNTYYDMTLNGYYLTIADEYIFGWKLILISLIIHLYWILFFIVGNLHNLNPQVTS